MATPRRQTCAHGHKNWETGNGTRPAREDLLPSLLRLPPLRDGEAKQGLHREDLQGEGVCGVDGTKRWGVLTLLLGL